MSKVTKAELLSANATLLATNATLVERVQALEQALKDLQVKPARQIAAAEPSTVHLVHILSKLGWGGTATPAFLGLFVVIRKNNWFSVLPRKANKETQAFIKEINTLRFEKNLPGNWYKNTGIWMKFE